MKFKILDQKHSSFNELLLKKRQLLSEGNSDDIKKHAKLFLNKEQFESDKAFEARKKEIVYYNYPSEIANDFSSSVFSKQLNITNTDETDILNYFINNCDKKGNSLIDFMRKILNKTIKESKCLIGYDFPSSDYKPNNLMEETQLGLNTPFLYEVPLNCAIDWELDDNNRFNYIKLKKVYEKKTTPFELKNKYIVEYKIWYKEQNVVYCYIYNKEYNNKEEPSLDDDFNLVYDEKTDFPEIPILIFDIPDNMCVLDLIGGLVEEHIRNESALSYAIRRHLYAVPVFKQGPEIPGVHEGISEKQTDPTRGNRYLKELNDKGFVVIGNEDNISFAEPGGSAYSIQNDKVKDIVDEMYRIVGKMSNSIASQSSISRSGKSKEQDNRNKEMVLEYYGKLVKSFVKKLCNDLFVNILQIKGEWSISGLTNYKIIDREKLIEEAKALKEIEIPSKTFIKLLTKKNALEILEGINAEESTKIIDEINDYFDNEEVLQTTEDNINEK